jgi:hypothetical protein
MKPWVQTLVPPRSKTRAGKCPLLCAFFCHCDTLSYKSLSLSKLPTLPGGWTVPGQTLACSLWIWQTSPAPHTQHIALCIIRHTNICGKDGRLNNLKANDNEMCFCLSFFFYLNISNSLISIKPPYFQQNRQLLPYQKLSVGGSRLPMQISLNEPSAVPC